MGNWTVVPRWLYENDLPDDELQAAYAREARKKAEEIAAQLRRLDEERLVVASQLEAQLAFVAEAEERLRFYQERAQQRRAAVTEAAPGVADAVFTPRRRALPRPPQPPKGNAGRG